MKKLFDLFAEWIRDDVDNFVMLACALGALVMFYLVFTDVVPL